MNIQININEATRALTEKPMLAVSAERFLILDRLRGAFPELPQPLRFSRMLSILLAEVSVPLEPHDLIAGRIVDRELTVSEETRFREFNESPLCPNGTIFLSSGHCAYDWDSLIALGLPGLRKRAQTERQRAEDEDERIFFDAMIEIYDAIAAYMHRYAVAAAERGMDALAASLRNAADTAPATFRDALQLLWIITLIDCSYITLNPTLTLGRMDILLAPFYETDLAAGRITREEAAALITDYYCKHNLNMGRGEHQTGNASNSTTFCRILNFDAPQYLLLAGTDANGASAVNALTALFAECIVPSFKNPVVLVRYYKGMAAEHPDLWRTLMEKAMASASLMFYNDTTIRETFRAIGLPDDIARDYYHFGCNWAAPSTKSSWVHGGPGSRVYPLSKEDRRAVEDMPALTKTVRCNYPKAFLDILHTLTENKNDVTIEDFYAQFLAFFEKRIDDRLAYLSAETALRRKRPAGVLSFGDCFLDESAKKHGCISAVSEYHFDLLSFQMFGTVADCFIAVDQLVFREKLLSLRELCDAVDANFVGHERTLAMCRSAEKYGMDTPLSNLHTGRLSRAVLDLIIEKSRPYLAREKLFLEPCMQSDTQHLHFGLRTGATPDGRLAGETFSQNARPSNGACTNGITGMFNAMLHLPSDRLLSGALNLDIDPRQFAGEEGCALFGTLLAGYFDRGGLHAQVTSVRVDDLIDAQKNPHAHRDLRVRVTGYSGVFVDIGKPLQDDIINRLK